MIGEIIGLIIFGAVIGLIARAVRPGPQKVGALVTVLIGIVGALAGYFIWGLISNQGDTPGIDWIRLIISVVVAVVLLGIYMGATAKKGRGGTIKK